jgi:hypothetical protein
LRISPAKIVLAGSQVESSVKVVIVNQKQRFESGVVEHSFDAVGELTDSRRFVH